MKSRHVILMLVTTLLGAPIQACSPVEDATGEPSAETHADRFARMSAFDGYYYRIRNVSTGKVMEFNNGNSDNGAKLQQWNYDPGVPWQRFLIVPAEADYFYLVNKHSGKVVELNNGDRANRAKAQQWDCAGVDWQKFAFEPFDSGSSGVSGPWIIRNKYTDKVLELNSGDRRNGARIQQWSYAAEEHQRWYVEAVEAIDMPQLEVPEAQPFAIGRPPLMSSPESVGNISDETPPRIIGSTIMPLLYVHDSIPPSQQARTTPYYKLVRRQFWRRKEQKTYDSGSAISKEFKVTLGMSSERTASLEERTGFEMGTDGKFSFKGLSLSLGHKFSHELKVATTSITKRMESYETTLKHDIPARSGAYTLALWVLVDEYALYRMKADVPFVDSWRVESNDYVYWDGYLHNP